MDLADLLAYMLALGRGSFDLASGAVRPPHIVVESGSDAPGWLPYAQALGAVASAVAVLVAIFIPTRIQQRALKHDREARVLDDARPAVAASVDAAQKHHSALIRRRKWAPRRAELEKLRADIAAGRRMRPAEFNADWEFVESVLVEEKSALEDTRRTTNLALLYFPHSTEVGMAVSLAYLHLARVSLLLTKHAATAADDDGPVAEALTIAEEGITSLGRTVSALARGRLTADAPAMPDWEVLEESTRREIDELNAEIVKTNAPTVQPVQTPDPPG